MTRLRWELKVFLLTAMGAVLLMPMALSFTPLFGAMHEQQEQEWTPEERAICGDERPCDPKRPWMRGSVEKKCDRLGDPENGVLRCACKHSCDKDNKYANETKGRRWDARCEARCNPAGCRCPNRCSQT